MARPLRIEFAGALYHVTARGNERKDIFNDDDDRRRFLEIFDLTISRHDWICHAYCLMSNHYHFLVETINPNLSKGMKFLNGSYTQYFNRRHMRVGHLFQGRYHGVLVEQETYLLELSRYIVLNPVRAEMVYEAKDWPWSSYRATSGICEPQELLKTNWVLSAFSIKKVDAQSKYIQFVSEGDGQPSPWDFLKNQIYLGSDAFVDEVQCKINPDDMLEAIPKPQKQSPKKPLSFYEKFTCRSDAITEAYKSGNYTQTELGNYHKVSIATISRIINTSGNVKCKM